MEDSFSLDWEWGVISCAIYFYYYYISSTSGHQALDPGGWGPLF